MTNQFHGDIQGQGTLEYLMIYLTEASGKFIGLERVTGRIGERAGSFVRQHEGGFERGVIKSSWVVAPGSGTGELRGLQGQGGYAAYHGQPDATYTWR